MGFQSRVTTGRMKWLQTVVKNVWKYTNGEIQKLPMFV